MWVIYDKVGHLVCQPPCFPTIITAVIRYLRSNSFEAIPDTTILLTLMMLSQVSDSSLNHLCILAAIVLWSHFSPLTINPCPSLLVFPGSLYMTFSSLTSYLFPLRVIAGYSLQTPRSLISPWVLCHFLWLDSVSPRVYAFKVSVATGPATTAPLRSILCLPSSLLTVNLLPTFLKATSEEETERKSHWWSCWQLYRHHTYWKWPCSV